MKEAVITSVAEFQARLQELETDEAGLLYRGQADVDWPVSCSAARRLRNDHANPIEDQLISSPLVGYLEFLVAKARMRGFLPPGFSEPSPDLELLAHLQHQGAATGLIDFTRQSAVALWFACSEHNTKDGAVYILPRSATEEISKSSDLKENIQSFYGEDKMWSWEPSALGNRSVAQSSVFVFGVPTVASDRMKRLLVQADSKVGILNQLATDYKINEEILFPDFPGYAVANASNKTFDVKRTVRYWREQIELASDDIERALAHYKCGEAYSAIREHKDAIVQYDAAILINPEFVQVYNNRGNAKAELGRYEEAIEDYDKVIGADSEADHLLYNNRGLALAELGKYIEAIEDYGRAIDINPDYAMAYVNRSVVMEALRCYKEALADADKAIRLNLEFAEAYIALGIAKDRLGWHAAAIEDYDKAVRLNPRLAEAYHSRGVAKAKLGRYKEAIADFDEAICIKPDYARAYLNRGLAKKSLRQYAAAIEDFRQAQALAQEQGRTDLLHLISQELDDLKSKDADAPPFQVAAHRSGYAPGVDPEKVKESLDDTDDDSLTRKGAT